MSMKVLDIALVTPKSTPAQTATRVAAAGSNDLGVFAYFLKILVALRLSLSAEA